MLGIEIVGIKLAHPMMKAQPFAQPTRGSGADQRRVMARGGAGIPGLRLYDLYKPGRVMGEIAISQARENLAEVIESTQRSGEPIVLTRHGRPVAVVLEHAAFERLVEEADGASDRAALAQAREDDDSVPWEQVKVDLGLV